MKDKYRIQEYKLYNGGSHFYPQVLKKFLWIEWYSGIKSFGYADDSYDSYFNTKEDAQKEIDKFDSYKNCTKCIIHKA